MSRPAITPISSGTNGWDGTADDDFDILANAPIPIYRNPAFTTLALLQTAYPAAAHEECLVWANLTTLGYTLCWSDGTQWLTYSADKRPLRATGGTISQLITDRVVRWSGGATATYNLLAAATWAGATVSVRNDNSGNLTIDPSGAETINGAATIIVAAGATASLYSDGTTIYTL